MDAKGQGGRKNSKNANNKQGSGNEGRKQNNSNKKKRGMVESAKMFILLFLCSIFIIRRAGHEKKRGC